MSEYVSYLLELLAPLGNVNARRMFGGHGIYHHDLMFALVADDTLYIKADDKNRASFTELNLEPFVYYKQGKPYSLSYYRAPEEALEESEILCQWADSGYQASVRAVNKKSAKRKS